MPNKGQFTPSDEDNPVSQQANPTTIPTKGQFTSADEDKPSSSIGSDPSMSNIIGSMMSTGGDILSGAKEGVAGALGFPLTGSTMNDINQFSDILKKQVMDVAKYPLSKGGALVSVPKMVAGGLWQSGKGVIQNVKDMWNANSAENFSKGASGALTNALLLRGLFTGVPEDAEPATLGMKYGGATAQIERIANRIPLSSRPLQDVYSQVADRFNSTVADSINKEVGTKVSDPTDLVGSLNKGADAIKSQAQAAYKPVDAYVAANNQQFAQYAMRQILTIDPELFKKIPSNFADQPINGIKVMRDMLDKKVSSLMNAGQGSEAHKYVLMGEDLDNRLNKVTNGLPPPIQLSYQKGQELYSHQAAMREVADTFDKNISGLTISRQPTGLAKVPQQVTGISLVDALKDEPKLKQAFGPDVADAITQHAHRVALSQALKGGSSNAANIVGMMYGTSILARMWTGSGMATIPGELGGVYVLSKVLSNPPSLPAYANMLRATTVTAQDYWGKQAVNAAIHGSTINHSASTLSPSDRKFLGDIHGTLPPDLRNDIGAALQ